MSDSNVVAEYTGPHDRPLRKYPEVAIINGTLGPTGGIVQTPGVSESQRGYTVTSSSSWGNGGTDTRAAWCAFDEGKSTTTYKIWQSGNYYTTATPGLYNRSPAQSHTADGVNYEGEWIKLELPRKINISAIEINATAYSSLTGHVGGRPYEGAILGSNDDSTWSLLKSFSGGLSWATTTVAEGGGRVTLTPDTNTTNKYRYIMLIVNKIQGSRSSVDINEIKYYGYEEGSASLDTTLKSVYNVPATTGTQLEVYYDAKDLGDGAVTNVTDLSPNSNGGSPTDVSVSDGAFVFNGTSSLLEKTSLSIPGGDNPLTFSFWVKSDDFDNTQYIFRLGDNTTTYQTIALYKNTSSQFVFATWALDFPINYTFTSNQWNHVSLVYPGGGWKQSNLIAYVDGKPYTFGGNVSVGGVGGTVMSLATSLTLRLGGYSSGTQHFDGSIANVRLYSKALNAEQVQELYDYQKDYFLGSKSQVTLYKGHLGVGVTEPSGQLELAGDERIQEYPPRDLGGFETMIEGEGTYKVSSSSDVPNPALGSFDHPATAFTANDTFFRGITNDYAYNTGSPAPYIGIHFTNGIGGDFLQIELPYKIYLKSINITARTSSSLIDRAPHTGFIFGSNDSGTTWSQVTSWSGLIWTVGESKPIQINSNTLYSTYRLVANKLLNSTGSASRFNIDRWQLFGTPGPTTLDKGSLTLGRSLDVPRISRYDVDTETPRPEKLVVDFDTTVNSSPTDISGQGNHMTFHGNASYSEADKAFVFDGTTGTYMSGTQNLGTGTPAHTITGWFKRTSTLTEYTWIFTIGTSATGQMSGLLIDPQGDIVFDIFNHRIETQKRINNNEWYHFAGVFNGASSTWSVDTCDVYINGVLEPTQSTGTSPQTFNLTGNQIYFGTSTNFLRYSSCLISNFKLYNVALEPSEVQKLYRLGRTGRSMVISDTAVGIGKAPEAQLDVRGNLKVGGTIQVPLIISHRWINADTSVADANYIPYNSVIYENPPGIHSGTIFTCPVKGVYECHFASMTDNNGTYTGNHEWYVNGTYLSPRRRGYAFNDLGSVHKQAGSHYYIECNSGDTIGVISAGTQTWYGHSTYSHSHMSIRLITPT